MAKSKCWPRRQKAVFEDLMEVGSSKDFGAVVSQAKQIFEHTAYKTGAICHDEITEETISP